MAEYEIFDPNEEFREKNKNENNRWKGIIIIIIIVALGAYFITGVYQVGPSEVALVKTFGAYTSTTGPGIHVHLPYPFQSHVKVNVRTINKIEIGFRTASTGLTPSYRTVNEEANMITGDQNIISIEAVVQYRINDPVSYAFNVMQGHDLVKVTSESVLRERVALSNLDDVLTTERDRIAMESAQIIQEILDSYNSGVQIENVYLQSVDPPDPVVAAFDDVNNARQDQEKFINEAKRYTNDIIPKAEGEAQKILNEAQAYAYEQVAKATGETERFKAILYEYQNAEEITRKRMILDSIEQMISNANVKILSEKGNSLNILDLTELIGGEMK